MALSEQERQAAMTISNGIIYFAYDSFTLTAASEGVLSQKAQVIKQFPKLRVTIEGHCDERGTQEYNLALGERRARAAYDYLVNMGVNAAQLEMVSFGKLHPAVMGHNEAAWSKNRRDEFKVYKPR
jgi:peptidoglycan-associated lipoprotein